ncbi:ParB N-terminal domain-containing protein, partial [Candidatus Micrarchaeota archaeon]|nr:ParB N-terminal domain-containing protein [Candidatus Micrarchaeota archaeon]
MSIYEEIYEKLEIIKVKDLKHHEERVPHNLLRLKEAMLNIGQIVDPIIVDKKTNIVLDGNHRLKVLELIKVPYSVCQMVDYKGEEITLGSWFPVRDKITKEQLEGI